CAVAGSNLVILRARLVGTPGRSARGPIQLPGPRPRRVRPVHERGAVLPVAAHAAHLATQHVRPHAGLEVDSDPECDPRVRAHTHPAEPVGCLWRAGVDLVLALGCRITDWLRRPGSIVGGLAVSAGGSAIPRRRGVKPQCMVADVDSAAGLTWVKAWVISNEDWSCPRIDGSAAAARAAARREAGRRRGAGGRGGRSGPGPAHRDRQARAEEPSADVQPATHGSQLLVPPRTGRAREPAGPDRLCP